MRSMLTTFINALMSAEADADCGAEYGARSEARTNARNGYRHPHWHSGRCYPKLRQGCHFPDWPLERRRRAEAVLTTVVAYY